MVLRTRRLAALALVPPGSVERELSLLASKVFARTGEPSSLACPGLLFLAAGSIEKTPIQVEDLDRCWKDIVGGFRGGGPVYDRGGLYLRVDGPLEALAARASALLRDDGDFPLRRGFGFFLGFHGPESATALVERAGETAVPLAFSAARLSLLSLDVELPGLTALAWKEEVVSVRKGYRSRFAARQRGTS